MSFEVNRLAGKHDIRKAVESLFDVKVIAVHTQNRKGKPRRTKMRMSTTKSWKKAIVTLDKEHRINFFLVLKSYIGYRVVSYLVAEKAKYDKN